MSFQQKNPKIKNIESEGNKSANKIEIDSPSDFSSLNKTIKKSEILEKLNITTQPDLEVKIICAMCHNKLKEDPYYCYQCFSLFCINCF